MPVYLPTSVLASEDALVSLGYSAEIMAWFYPERDHAQQIHQCMPCLYLSGAGRGELLWSWNERFSRSQSYLSRTSICKTVLHLHEPALEWEFTDFMPQKGAGLVRTMTLINHSPGSIEAGVFHFGDWNLGGIRMGNGVYYDADRKVLVQRHRECTALFGGDALEIWQCGKAGRNWANNALYDLEDGYLNCQDLEIGDVNWAFGRRICLQPGARLQMTAFFVTGKTDEAAWDSWKMMQSHSPEKLAALRQKADEKFLMPGLQTLEQALQPEPGLQPAAISHELQEAYERSLLCLPMLCGKDGAAVAAPEFDPEFVACGGYGYFWPRDGAEYVSGLMDAGYMQYAKQCLQWCASYQEPEGFWHQRYFLNGQSAPNWCLPPEHLQVDQVGAVMWACGKWAAQGGRPTPEIKEMLGRAADYLVSRLTSQGVHASAFDTWETFIGSFTYSNAATWAGLQTAAALLNRPEYAEAAHRVKEGVLHHFVHNGALTRGFDAHGCPDATLDSSALGAIEPFGMLNLHEPRDLAVAEATLHAILEHLETDFEGGRAIRRFQGDAYVGGVPACVNTLWMARCCCAVAMRIHQMNREEDAQYLADKADLYLHTVLRRATPTGLLPELMQGPEGARYWAAPHGWAMASFLSALLLLARTRALLAAKPAQP